MPTKINSKQKSEISQEPKPRKSRKKKPEPPKQEEIYAIADDVPEFRGRGRPKKYHKDRASTNAERIRAFKERKKKREEFLMKMQEKQK